MKTERNNKKRHGLLIVFLVLNWLAVAWVVWNVDPENIKNIIIPGIYLPMLILVFGALFWLFSILFLSAKMALRWASGVCLFVLLRFLDMGTVLNGFLILGLLISYEVYRLGQNTQNNDTDSKKREVAL